MTEASKDVAQAQPTGDVQERLRLFEELLARQREREAGRTYPEALDRGWCRDDPYDRGRSR